jgi:hypothetical protein
MSHLRRAFAIASIVTLILFFALPPGAISQTAPGQGKTTIPTSGTPVQLLVTNPVTIATVCTITALSTNTGTVWLGFSSAVSAANKIGTPLGPSITSGQPGGSYACLSNANTAFWNLGGFWLDVTNSGDGVSFSWK